MKLSQAIQLIESTTGKKVLLKEAIGDAGEYYKFTVTGKKVALEIHKMLKDPSFDLDVAFDGEYLEERDVKMKMSVEGFLKALLRAGMIVETEI